MNFSLFNQSIRTSLDQMSSGRLFEVDIDKDELYQLYLSSFPDGTNPMFRQRTEYDCSCCKQFIRNCGGVVAIENNKLVSIWDVVLNDQFQIVADKMSQFVKSHAISNVYYHDSTKLGVEKNYERNEDGTVITWQHFNCNLENKFVKKRSDIATLQGTASTNKQLLERSLKEITLESIDIVLDLIGQQALYRGDEHLSTVQLLKKTKVEYDKLNCNQLEQFMWKTSLTLNMASRFRNTVIGTLLTDISNDVELDVAVKSFENKVAPQNYKRPKSLITQGMVDNAQQQIETLDIENSLYRRYAVPEDITINNVLFADRQTKPSMKGALSILEGEIQQNIPKSDDVQTVSIDDFLTNILPKLNSIEVMVDNAHQSNFVNLIAPVHNDCVNLFKWDNQFSWSYKGDVADSIKHRVKKAGGDVSGDLRCSLAWYNYDDLDIHVYTPSHFKIYHANKHDRTTDGILDVDMNAGCQRSRNAVENVTWKNKSKLTEGEYKVVIHNYNKHETIDNGFEVELEFDNVVQKFEYTKSVDNGERVTAVKFNYCHANGVQIIDSIPSCNRSVECWGVNTNKWTKVSMIMNSPNHWDGHKTGNKHVFFMLDGCINPDNARGFYNEFLTENLTEYRKVFEVLGSKMKTQPDNNQLSGIGFSSTKSNTLLCRVQGSFNRVIKIQF